jgi:glycosyltransferase involved in cell wall biosynthesis
MRSGPAPIQVTLLGNDPGDGQWSILRYGENLLDALRQVAKGNFQFQLIAPDTRHLWPSLRRRRLGQAGFMYMSRYFIYPKLVRPLRSDIFHILDHGNSWLVRFLKPARTVVTCHDLIPKILFSQSDSLWPALSSWLHRHAISGLPKANAIITNSFRTKDDLIRHLPVDPHRVHVIPLAPDPVVIAPQEESISFQARQALGLPEGFLILHVGRPAFYKNLPTLFQAFAILLRQESSAWLIRAGGKLPNSLKRLARALHIHHRLREFGSVDPIQLHRLYQACHVLAFPSWYEGQGLPPLEAMVCGMPVVVSDRGALPETVRTAALIVPADRPRLLAQALRKVWRQPDLRQRLRHLGFQRAQQFHWKSAAEKTLQLYESLFHQP